MKAALGNSLGQMIVLVLVGAGWLFSLVEFYAYHVTTAQPIADAGWGALLAILQINFGASGAATPKAPGA